MKIQANGEPAFVFKTLADPTRLRLLHLLACGEPPQLEALPERVVRLRCRAAAGVDVAEPLELGFREHG